MFSRRELLKLTKTSLIFFGTSDHNGLEESFRKIGFDVIGAQSTVVALQKGANQADKVNPWGIATSHSRSKNLGWLSDIAKSGISALRGFDRNNVSKSLEVAFSYNFEVSGILQMGSSFPSDKLDEWEAWIVDIVTATEGRVTHWEIWNEPPNFSTDKSPEAYSAIVKRAYEVVKRINPELQVGICASSVNLQFMESAIQAGAANCFDYVTLHPYETMGLLSRNFESLFLSIVPTTRKMLTASSPLQKDVPIIFTEIGQLIEDGTTYIQQAQTLVKVYVLSLVQGVARIHWFEGVDGDSGPFGLINNDGIQRPSFFAAKYLISSLGEFPIFSGWVEILGSPRAFVFQGDEEPVLVAWAPQDKTIRFEFEADAQVIIPESGKIHTSSSWLLTSAPIIVSGFSSKIVELARANLGKPIPWDGDYTNSRSVSFDSNDTEGGIHAAGISSELIIDTVQSHDFGDAAAHAFTVDPNFLSYDSDEIRIIAEVRRTGLGDAGFNMKYESVNGIVTAGAWNTLPEGEGWHTFEWKINNARFVGKWGYHLLLDSDSIKYSQYALRRLTVEKL